MTSKSQKHKHDHNCVLNMANLTHEGRTFVDKKGRSVILHGMNLMNKRSPWYIESYYNLDGSLTQLAKDTAKLWAENGLNVARLGFAWKAIETSPGVYNDVYILKLREMVRLFAQYNITTFIDFHQDMWNDLFCSIGDQWPDWAANTIDPATNLPVEGCTDCSSDCPYGSPGSECYFYTGYYCNKAMQQVFDNFWHDVPSAVVGDTVGVQTRFANMIKHVAVLLKDEPYIIYNPTNEPWGTKAYWNCVTAAHPEGGDPVIEYPTDSSALCQAQIDFGQIIFKNMIDKVTDSIRSADKKHMIIFGSIFLESGSWVPNLPKPKDHNTGFANSGYGLYDGYFPYQQATNTYIDTCEALNVPHIVTEFGAGFNPPEFVIPYLNERKVSWIYWSYWNVDDAPEVETILINNELPPTDDNLRLDQFNVVVEPYPSVVAGTINYYSYKEADGENKNGIFRFSYNKRAASGCCNISRKCLTHIHVPKRSYPNGYNISVSGATIVSTPGSDHVLLKRNKCDSEVTVEIRPLNVQSHAVVLKPKQVMSRRQWSPRKHD